MANYSKSFNFRNGVQVDDDNLVIDGLGKVGIGTTVPLEFLDVRGNTTVSGFATASSLYAVDGRVSGVLTATTLTDGKITINSGIISASSGVVTFYGDGTGLVNIPTSQWVDTDVGLGYTSIYAAGSVGIATTDPRYTLQVGGNNNLSNFVNGVGINSTGDILATGIITASTVRASLAATFLTGTIDNARLASNINVSGIVTATTFVGNLTGTATTSQFLTGSPSISVTNISSGIITATDATITSNAAVGGFVSVGSTLTTGGSLTVTGNGSVSGILTAANVKSGLSTVGISTVYDSFHVGTSGALFAVTSAGNVGLGSGLPTSDLLVRKEGATLVEVISNTNQARISIGQSVGVGNSSGLIRFGTSPSKFEIVNNAAGDLTFLINGSGLSSSNKFSWINGYGNQELMFLTHDGKLGIGITNPSTNLHVVGTSTVTGNATFASNVTINGTLTAGSFSVGAISGNLNGNVNATSGFSTFSNVIVSSGSSLGIGTETPTTGLDARNQTGLFGSIGVGTDTFYGSEVLSVLGSVTLPDGGVGIGTTYIDPAGASLQLYTPLIDLNEGHLNIKTGSVGFSTSEPKAIFDFGNVGSATTRPVMVVPNVNSTTRNGIGQTPAGSIIFNITTSKFQGYTGVAWTDFH